MERGNPPGSYLFAPSMPPIVTDSVTAQIQPSTFVTGDSERQLSGLKPIVPLRKRGQSFRETKSIISFVDSDGRRHLNQYTFLEELGRGAYGTVIKVESNETKEVFAAKMVNKKGLGIWKRFKHRHIVVLREVIDTDEFAESDELYMISELIDGGTVLDDGTCTLPPGIDAYLLRERMCEMESEDESLRQTAGTAIFMGAAERIVFFVDYRSTDEKESFACAPYVAPEMPTDERFRGKPVDIWACGVTLYMFVYGHPPFEARTMTEVYDRIQNEEVQYREQVGERVVEKELIDLLQHILEKDPNKRYSSAEIRAHPWA
ncbi:Camkk/camkk-meta protein kinase, partial [Globisporangium splendens]